MFNVALSSSLKFQGIALGRSRLFEVKHVANVIWLMTSSMPFLNTNRESTSRGPSVTCTSIICSTSSLPSVYELSQKERLHHIHAAQL